MSNIVVGIILISGGTWLFQDALASILYYLKRDNERWYFNHAVRLFRALWGIVFIVLGIMVIIQDF